MAGCKMQILVTGGAGFIGSNLSEALLQLGHHVRVLDNFSTGKRENLEFCKNNPRFELIEGDIRDFSCCKDAVSGCDVVFHEAALGSVPRSVANPQMSLEVNAQGFINMIESARISCVKRFVYASSSSVYGDERTMPKQENRTGKALSPYALSKQMNEAVAENYAGVYSFQSIGLRYFNVFGRRQDPDGAYAAVIPKFVMSLLEHKSPVINGNGSFSRDFTYIDNVIQANLLAMQTEDPSSVNQVYNIACGKQTSLNELFLLLREFLAEYDEEIRAIEPVYGPERMGDIPHSLADIEKAAVRLNYVPEIDVNEGLRQTASWYSKKISGI